jgi:hypothetical protein
MLESIISPILLGTWRQSLNRRCARRDENGRRRRRAYWNRGGQSVLILPKHDGETLIFKGLARIYFWGCDGCTLILTIVKKPGYTMLVLLWSSGKYKGGAMALSCIELVQNEFPMRVKVCAQDTGG